MISNTAPSLADLLRRTVEIAPALRARALETEALRRVPDENIRLLKDIGLFRLYQPTRFGGFELPYGTLQLAVSAELGEACGSTAWVQSVLAVHAWMLGSFSEEAQAAVWGKNVDALVASSGAPIEFRVEPARGGIVLSGEWEFSSGSEASDWIVLRIGVKNGTETIYRWCLLPMSSVEIVDVWYATGLRGSGSQNVRVHDVFVPEAFMVDAVALRGSTIPLYGLPYMGVFQYAISTPAIGIAKGALKALQVETRGRPERRAQSSRQLRYALSSAEIDAAELVLARVARDFEAATADGLLLGTDDRVRFKRDTSYAVNLCRTAVDRLVQMVGAHGVADKNPLQRAFRDVAAIANHQGVSWDSSGELFGSFAFGILPKDRMALTD